MKKLICVLSLFSICAGMFTTATPNVKAEEQEVIDSTDYKVEKITGEENIKKYQESLGEEYDPNIVEIYKIVDVDKEEIANKQARIGNDWFIKNKTVSTKTDTSKLLRQWKRPAGTVTISQTVSVSNSFTATGGIKSSVLSAELGFNVTGTESIGISWSGKYSYPVTISVYPIYQTIKGELWEDDVFFDDKIGTFTVKRAVGDDIRVKKTT